MPCPLQTLLILLHVALIAVSVGLFVAVGVFVGPQEGKTIIIRSSLLLWYIGAYYVVPTLEESQSVSLLIWQDLINFLSVFTVSFKWQYISTGCKFAWEIWQGIQESSWDQLIHIFHTDTCLATWQATRDNLTISALVFSVLALVAAVISALVLILCNLCNRHKGKNYKECDPSLIMCLGTL